MTDSSSEQQSMSDPGGLEDFTLDAPMKAELQQHKAALTKEAWVTTLASMALQAAYFGIVVTAIVALTIWGTIGYFGWLETKLNNKLDESITQKSQEIENLKNRLTVLELKANKKQ